MWSLLFLLSLHSTVQARLTDDVRTNFMSTVFERSITDDFTGEPSVASHGVNIIFHDVTEQEILAHYLSIESFVDNFCKVISTVNPDVTLLSWRQEPLQGERFNFILVVAVVETMTTLYATEAIQLIKSTLQDPRVHMLPIQPQNVSFSGISPGVSIFGDVRDKVLLGDTVMLTCVATGNPVPFVAWLKDGSPLSGNALDRNGIMYINEFAIENTGDYTCVANSVLGSAETHLSLTVVRKCEKVLRSRCVDGTCLPVVMECDGHKDCVDESDEENCPLPRPPCRPDEVECEGVNGGCVFKGYVCDGVKNCVDGSDEGCTGTTPPESPCLANQFSCTGGCVPLRALCDGLSDCPNAEDEKSCTTYREVEIEEPTVTVPRGANVTLRCSALGGFPSPFVTWFKDLSPLEPDYRFVVTSTNGRGSLIISDVTGNDTGRYSCVVRSNLGSEIVQPDTRLVVTAENSDDVTYCEDSDGTLFTVGEQYLVSMDTTTGQGTAEAADIIIVVDESGSMIGEHQWLERLVFELENSLQLAGVGVNITNPNMYALVGFARDDDTARGGVVIQGLGSMQQFASALKQLTLTGIFEDGYSGIDVALRNIPTRPGTAKQMVLVTDEHRGILNFRLTKEDIIEKLQMEGFKLNVVVNQGFEADVDIGSVIGIDSAGMGYVYNSSIPDLYSPVAGGRANVAKSFRLTNEDYVKPALQLGGGAWDLNLLRLDEKMTTAFTNAFVHVNVEETLSTFGACFRCNCGQLTSHCTKTTIPLHECRGLVEDVQPVVVVNPLQAHRQFGSTVVFQCLSHPVSLSDPILRYSWYHRLGNRITLLQYGTNDTLLLEQVRSEDGGQYVCEAESRNGVKQNASSTLVVFVPPVQVVVTPANPDANIGDNVTIVCSINSSVPVAQYVWTLNGRILPRNVMVMDNGTHSLLTITNFEADNMGVYQCRAIVDTTITGGDVTDVLEVKIFGQSNLTVSEGDIASFTCLARCMAPGIACVGLSVNWTRHGDVSDNDIQLPDGAKISTEHANTTLSFPSAIAGDMGVYVCTGSTQNFSSSVAAYLTVKAVPVTMVTPKTVSTVPNKPVTLHCTSNTPQAMCSFYNGSDVNSTSVIVTGEGGVDLQIMSAQSSDAGSYVCRCVNSEGSSEDNGTIVLDCIVRQSEVVADSETVELCSADVPDGTPTGACVVFIVDESLSMKNEHQWLIGFSQLLEEELNNAGIGQAQSANRYGLVGFGAADYERGRIIDLTADGQDLASASQLRQGIDKLMLDGRNEDGYAGIEMARQLIMHHPHCLHSNMARQFILVTDEERDIVVPELNRSVIYDHLKNFGLLNIAVSEAFECKTGEGPYDFTDVLGLDGNHTGYSTETGEEMSITECRSKPDSGYVTTNQDYTELAFQLGGGAWNLNQLREGGNKTSSFTRAFLAVKVKEIVDQLNCVTCSCLSGDIDCGQEIIQSNPTTS